MFGYIMVNKPELKIKDFDLYRSYYCGLCHDLKEGYGQFGRLSLSYDMNFIAVLLSGLYEPEENDRTARCLLHPVHKCKVRQNVYTRYAADMNIIFAYFKSMDDWIDEKKFNKYIYTKLLKKKNGRVVAQYAKKAQFVYDQLEQLHECEKRKETDLDLVGGLFGDIMGEIMVYQADEWEETLRKLGFYLGKFIYFIDAFEDLEEDLKKGNYNPYLAKFGPQILELRKEEIAVGDQPMFVDRPMCYEEFDRYVYEILQLMIAECSKAFERLPIVEHIDVLRNVLYSGVWCRFATIHNKRTGKKDDDGSL